MLTPEAGKKAFAQAGLRRVGFDLAADCLRPVSASPEVGIDLGTVPEVVGDDRVDVVESKSGQVLRDFLWGGACHEGVDHGIQGDPGTRDADHPVGVGRERNGLHGRGSQHENRIAEPRVHRRSGITNTRRARSDASVSSR